MARRGKTYVEKAKLVDREKHYAPREALALVKQTARANFDETVEVALQLGVDPRHAEQQVRGTVQLPHGTGRTMRIAVFAKGEKAEEAEQAGADIVGAEELIAKVEQGEMDFNLAIATPDMMALVGRLGRVLGPRGLMPNPRAGTVTFDVGQAVEEFKGGKVEFRVNKDAGMHVPIGKASFSEEALEGNFKAFIDAIVRARPAAARGQFVRRVAISTTMGPGIRINPQEAVNFATETEE